MHILNAHDSCLFHKIWSSKSTMICERSCDSEDWSNDAENAALPNRNNYIQIENCYFKLWIYFTLLLFFIVFSIK